MSMTEREWKRHQAWMDMARVISTLSTCNGHRVGAVLIRDHRVISMGYNGSPSGCDHCNEEEVDCWQIDGSCARTVHAEQNAVIAAALQGVSTKDTICYTTLYPCLECSKILVNAGVKQIYYLRHHKTHALAVQTLSQAGVGINAFREFLETQ